MAKETTVWIKPLDLPWEQVGTGGFQGVTPENINLEADTWGPSNATFDLRREPDAPALDLSAGAEVEVHVAGVNVWDGFVSSTPKKRGDLVVSVVCRGWQDELDGRIFTAGYVHTSLSDFKDARSFVDTTLGSSAGLFAAAPSVSTDKGITLMWPKSTVVAAYGKAGAILDLGPGLTGKRVVVTWESSNNDASTQAVVAGSDAAAGPSTGTSLEDIITVGLASGASGTSSASFTTARRYISFRIQDTGSGHTPGSDVWFKVTACKVFAATAYESGDASILKASTVVTDALDRGTLALSSDRSGIDTTSFSIPDLWPDPKGVTARELISKVNAYHNWTAKLEPGKRFVFRARTTTPKVKVGEWSALPDDEDASANDITDVYNHCRATSTEPGGALVVVDRYAAQMTGAVPSPAAAQPSNPSFATNTTGWTAASTTITRDTVTYASSPASGRWDKTGASDAINVTGSLSTTVTGPFLAGVPYTVVLYVKRNGGSTSDPSDLALDFGDVSTANYAAQSSVQPGGGFPWSTFQACSLSWVPTVATASATIRLRQGVSSFYYHVDEVSIFVKQPTILDKRGRVRSQILDATAALPADGVALTQLADTWLAAHMSTPFKGKQAIQGSHSVRDYLNGDNVAPERLLGMTTDLLHFDDRNNPDTGDVGRDGRLVKVSYQPATDTAQTDVDSTRSDFGALLARIGVLASS